MKGYDDYVKESIKEKKWGYLEEGKILRKIENTPSFLIRDTFPLYLGVALEELDGEGKHDKLDEIYRLTSKILPCVTLEKRVSVFKSIVEKDSLKRKRSITNKVINSVGWLIKDIISLHKEDDEFIEIFTETINELVKVLAPEGYALVKISYANGKVTKVPHVTVEDIKDEELEVDIITEGDISIAY